MTEKEVTTESLLAEAWDCRYLEEIGPVERIILDRLLDGGYIRVRDGKILISGRERKRLTRKQKDD